MGQYFVIFTIKKDCHIDWKDHTPVILEVYAPTKAFADDGGDQLYNELETSLEQDIY